MKMKDAAKFVVGKGKNRREVPGKDAHHILVTKAKNQKVSHARR